MFKYLLALSIAAAALGSNAFAVEHAAGAPVYFDGGQYSAALQQSAHHWHLQPILGDDVDVTDRASSCTSGTPVPKGVWLVTRDSTGQPQLLAPSTTALPPGYPEKLQLRVCGDEPDRQQALFVPAVVFDWINEHVGAVLIDD